MKISFLGYKYLKVRISTFHFHLGVHTFIVGLHISEGHTLSIRKLGVLKNKLDFDMMHQLFSTCERARNMYISPCVKRFDIIKTI